MNMQSASRIPVFRNGKNPAQNWKEYSPRGEVSDQTRQINGSLSKKDDASSIKKRHSPRTSSPQQSGSVGQGRHYVVQKSTQKGAVNSKKNEVSAGKDNTSGNVSPIDNKGKIANGRSSRTPSPLQSTTVHRRNEQSVSNHNRSRSTSPRDSASRIPRFSPRRERSPSPGRQKVHNLNQTNIKKQPEGKGIDFEEEDEFVRLEKMFAEEEEHYLSSQENGGQKVGDHFIVEQIVEEVHEPFQFEDNRSTKMYSLEKKSSLPKHRNFPLSSKRSLPSTPAQPNLKDSLVTNFLSSGKDNTLPIDQSIKSNDYHREILKTEKSHLYMTQQDNSVTCKKIDNKIREGDSTYKETPKKEQSAHLRKEFTTVDDKETHYVMEDGIQDKCIEINTPNSKGQTDFKDKFININDKSSISYSKYKENGLEATEHHVSFPTVGEKGNAAYRVLGDVYELNDVMRVPLLDTEANVKFPDDEELPSYDSLPHSGSVDYFAYDEIRYGGDDDETIETDDLGRDPISHGSNVSGFGKRSKRWDFPSHFLEDGALLTDIEEENTADIVPTSSLYSYRVDTDTRDVDWEEETIPSDSKRGSLDSVSFSVSIKPLTQSKSNANEQKDFYDQEADGTQNIYTAIKTTDSNQLMERREVFTEHLESNFSKTEVSRESQRNEQRIHTVNLPKLPTSFVDTEDSVSSRKVNILYTSAPYRLSEAESEEDTTYSLGMKSEVVCDIIEYRNVQYAHKEDYYKKPTVQQSPSKFINFIKDNNENNLYSNTENMDNVENPKLSDSKDGFEPMTIGTIRHADEDDTELKLSSRHSLAFGEMNPIKIECVKLCRSKSLKPKDTESETPTEYETTSNIDPGELEHVKVELKKMNTNISGLQKELHSAKEKVIRLRSGLAMIRRNRLLWKRCIQGTKS